MLAHEGTGVSTYARLLKDVQSGLSDCTFILRTLASRLPPAIGAIGRHARRTKLQSDAGVGYDLVARDIFRRAHVHFGLYGTLLPVSPAVPSGVMHWTYPIPLYMRGWINIYAIHDVIPILQPELSPVSSKRLHATLSEISKVADAVTTISDASLGDIAGLGLFPEDRIINTGLTIEDAFSPKPEMADPLALNGLQPKHYLLFSGSVEERKNVPRILAAYRRAGIVMPLVIVGPATVGNEGIENDIDATPGAIRLPYQTREALNALMAGAYALVFISLAEGFGLPIIEAMAKGTAVLSSKIAAIEEVAGDAALLVDPTDERAIADALRYLTDDRSVERHLVNKGLDRARFHSRERFARKMRGVYERFGLNPTQVTGLGRRV